MIMAYANNLIMQHDMHTNYTVFSTIIQNTCEEKQKLPKENSGVQKGKIANKHY